MRKKIKIWAALLIAAAIIIVAVFGAAWHSATLVLYPEVKCWPHYVKCGDPSEWGLAFEKVSCATSDGLNLPGWYIPAANSRKAVILVHGHGATINEGIKYAPALRQAGYNVLAITLRRGLGNLGEGETGKYFATMGCLEKKDVMAAVDLLASQKGQQAIGVFGFSMGAASAVLAMAEDTRIKAGVINSSYADIEEQLADVGKREYGLPRYPLLPLVVWIAGKRAGVSLYECNPVDYIARIAPRPVFIMQCSGDDYIDIKHGRKMSAAARDPRQFWAAPCNRHVSEWNQCRAEAERRVIDFFDRTLKP